MKKIKTLICLLVMAALLITPIAAIAAPSYVPISMTTSLYADFASIGKADSILISKNGNHMLVDTGEVTANKNDWPVIKEMLDQRNVTSLKALVITHYDVDHIGSYLNVIDYIKSKNGTIEHIYGRKYTSDQLNTLTPVRRTNYVKFINGILRYLERSSEEFSLTNYDTVTVAKKANELFGSGDGLWIFPTRTNSISNFTLDGNTTIKWLNIWTSYIIPGMPAEDVDAAINNDSLTFKLTYDTGDTMLFTGDISWTPQKDLYENCLSDIQNPTVFKVPHHGIPEYQNPNFISKVKPKFTIVTSALSDGYLPGLVNTGVYGKVYSIGKCTDITNYQAFYTLVLRQKVENNTHVYMDPNFPFYADDTN